MLHSRVRGFRGQAALIAFPNLFLTITSAEWKFPRPYWLRPYISAGFVYSCAYLFALHMHWLVMCVWGFLSNIFGHKFFIVLEWVVRLEYQGRCTPHWHIAAWVLPNGLLASLAGRSKTGVVSAFVKFLELLFCCDIDVQVGNGRLNYINGYVSKDHDAVDVGLGEYVAKENTAPWLSSFRLLSKSTPGIPEVAIRMASCTEFATSFSHTLLYPPQPLDMMEFANRQRNFSSKMYGFYIREKQQQLPEVPIRESFLAWHREREYDSVTRSVNFRGGRHQQHRQKTLVVACRYWYELTDGFWGQFALTQLPHSKPEQLQPNEFKFIEPMRNFAGMMEYLLSWTWRGQSVIEARGGSKFDIAALPLFVPEKGEASCMPLPFADGERVFRTDSEGTACAKAFDYIVRLAVLDLQYRGFRDERISSFQWKQHANHLLFEKVLQYTDGLEYEMFRQQWEIQNRPVYDQKTYCGGQLEALKRISEALDCEDENAREVARNKRWLYIAGKPGSGKSEVIKEAAVRAAKRGFSVLIVCPTGQLVHSFKSQLPDVDGVENIRVDTIHGVLNYKRPGKDSQVRWTPPSALRKIDLILVDEASQYDDKEWTRFFTSVREQPHIPFTVVVADFQQLQPVVSGGFCERMCQAFVERGCSVTLDTIYRSKDEAHLLFCNRIRDSQPDKPTLRSYFADRHLGNDLHDAVATGMAIQKRTGDIFVWLCSTNAGAAEVNKAALDLQGITDEDLATGYACDPASKSDTPIVAKPGILLRLTRNIDKQRGFVNGAIAVVRQVLQGNAVFIVELVGQNRRAGTLFLVHPMEEDGSRFLPCTYGYGTTIRRAQGASLIQGALWFDQHRHAAGRGYGYVGVSRFRSRAGCYIFGKLRRTDFLPVGEPNPAVEVLEREADSESDDSEDEYAAGLAMRGSSALNCGESDYEDHADPEAARHLVVRGDIAGDFEEDPAGYQRDVEFGAGLEIAPIDMSDFT